MTTLFTTPARVTDTFCFCRCHATTVGNLHDHAHAVEHHRFKPGVMPPMDPVSFNTDGMAPRADAVDAAIACDRCRPSHCLALLNPVPELELTRVRQAFASAAAKIGAAGAAYKAVGERAKKSWDKKWGTPPGELSDPTDP
jgi:hypothetical protein